MRERLVKWGIPVLVLATILVGCPLPFEFSGEGAGETARDPASPDVTAPVTFSYVEDNGASGTVATGGSHVSGVSTTVTLSTETPGAVIYYTTNGGLTNLNAATQISASSGSFTIARTASNEQRVITAIAVGPNMRPSPEATAQFDVSPFPILTVSVSPSTITENGGNGTFTITANTPPSSTLTVNLQTNSAYEAGDVNSGFPGPGTPPFTRDLNAGSTTITIPIIGQPDLDQTNDPVAITVLPGTGYSVGNQNQGTITIEDDQTPISSVTYDRNGAPAGFGDPPQDVNVYQPGNTVSVADNTGNLSRVGFVFGGWNTAADGGGTAYNPGDTFAMGSVDVTLYAVWIPAYTVSYDANNSSGGTLPSDTNQYQTGQTVTVAGNPGALVRNGYVFEGWNTAFSGTGATYNPLDSDPNNDSFVMGSSDVTLYALWIVATTVTYDGNGSDGGAVPIDGNLYKLGETVTVAGNPNSLSRTGFAFGGWNSQVDGTGTTYNDPYDPTSSGTFTKGSGNRTLYARWIPAYTVSYDANDATSGTAPADQAKVQSVNLTLETNSGTLQRSGHMFLGWNTQPDGSGVDYAAGATYFSNANLALYAKWEPVAPSIAVNVAHRVELTDGTTFVSQQPTFDVSSTGLTSATGLTFRLAVGTAPSTGVSHAADEEEVIVASGNAQAMSLPNSMLLALQSNHTVYVRQRGTSTIWSPAVALNLTVDRYSWVGRVAPDIADIGAVISDTTTRFIDLRNHGTYTHILGGAPLLISATVPKRIVGDGFVFDGGGLSRIFTVAENTNVELAGLTLSNGRDTGDVGDDSPASGSGAGGGGGGAAGVGGAIYIDHNASVEISYVTFDSNEALGGAGGTANSADHTANGGAGGGPNGGAGGLSTFVIGGNNAGAGGNAGGDFSGGGGGGSVDGGGAGAGGTGSYGGGGGGGGATSGMGGPGGGGNAGTYGGDGGNAGFNSSGAGGGGGAGLGGAIFVETGATLTIAAGVEFSNNEANGGAGGISDAPASSGNPGEGRGGAIFVRSGGTLFPAGLIVGGPGNSATNGDNTPAPAEDQALTVEP